VEFHLDADRKVQDVAIPQWDLHNAKPFYEEGITKRLTNGAEKVVRNLQFDPSDRTTPDPKRTYRVTVIFCIEPDNCGDWAVPFPDTEPITVKTTLPYLPFPVIPTP
jgi:hypothetical protein